MKKMPLLIIGIATLAFASFNAFAADLSIGFVNFKQCVDKSVQGQQERNAFESLKKQLGEALQKTDKELEDLAKKLEDQDYMDGLSPTAEEELKQRFQTLSQEFTRYQNQYYQMLNQANLRMIQSMHDVVCSAAEIIREKHALNFLINEDSAFACSQSLNFTDEVVLEMNKRFERENSSQTAITNQETSEGHGIR